MSGRLRILHLEAVLPDGLVVSYSYEEDEELEFDLTPYTDELAQRPMKISLAVPAKRVGVDQGRFRDIDLSKASP